MTSSRSQAQQVQSSQESNSRWATASLLIVPLVLFALLGTGSWIETRLSPEPSTHLNEEGSFGSGPTLLMLEVDTRLMPQVDLVDRTIKAASRAISDDAMVLFFGAEVHGVAPSSPDTKTLELPVLHAAQVAASADMSRAVLLLIQEPVFSVNSSLTALPGI